MEREHQENKSDTCIVECPSDTCHCAMLKSGLLLDQMWMHCISSGGFGRTLSPDKNFVWFIQGFPKEDCMCKT